MPTGFRLGRFRPRKTERGNRPRHERRHDLLPRICASHAAAELGRALSRRGSSRVSRSSSATPNFEKDGSGSDWACRRAIGLTVCTCSTSRRSRICWAPASTRSRKRPGRALRRSWLLTHYLAFAPQRQGQLTKYMNGIQAGRAPLAAATAAFGDLKPARPRTRCLPAQGQHDLSQGLEPATADAARRQSASCGRARPR